ncbi:MAG TPA: RNA polymerase sigma factor [Opitutaceae bacterium]
MTSAPSDEKMGEASFDLLVSEWYERLYRFALSLTRHREDALDLTQQTFIRWAEKGQQLRDRQRAKSWLFTVLYREFINGWRNKKHFDGRSAEDVLQFTPAETAGPEVSADGKLVLEALWQLEETFRAPLTLFYLKDLSYREIAEILAVPIGTVMSRLARGRDHLRELVETGLSRGQKIIPMPSKKGVTNG